MEKSIYRCGAVVLAAGAGKRMNTDTKKQFLEIHGKPIIYYSLKTFQESFVDEIVLVVSEEDVAFCQKEIVEKYQLTKVIQIAIGGKERYHSVAGGLAYLQDSDYVFIHDGARPMLTEEILNRSYEAVKEQDACVVGMPVKDTIKVADEDGFIATTPNRNLVWTIQTPQVFSYPLIKEAYDELLVREEELKNAGVNITDDAMVVETLKQKPVKLVEGSYENIKITTPDDLLVAKAYLTDFHEG